jgi:hypothetical protein
MLYPEDLFELIEHHYDETMQLLLDCTYTERRKKHLKKTFCFPTNGKNFHP